MKPARRLPPAGREAAREAARWRALGLLLERPRRGWLAELRGLACEIEDPRIHGAIAAADDATEGAYLSILGPGGTVSPREVGYRGREDPGRILADISAFYEAFAFHPRAEDPSDHIAIELGFSGYLRLKEAFALARCEDDRAETARDALARFQTDHLRQFAEPLVRRLPSAGPAYLRLAGEAIVERTGPAPLRMAPPPAPSDELDIDCGG